MIPEKDSIEDFLWNPDGTQLIIWREHSPTQTISADNGTILDELDTCYTRTVVWSPTGNQIACSVQGVLYLWGR